MTLTDFEIKYPSLKGCLEWKTLNDGTIWRVIGTYHIENGCVDITKVDSFIESIAPSCNLKCINDNAQISITKKRFLKLIDELKK